MNIYVIIGVMKNALGGWGKLFSFLKQANSGSTGKPLEIQMKKQKKPYVKVEMLIVTEKYQGQCGKASFQG